MILCALARDTMVMRIPFSDCAERADGHTAGIRRPPRAGIHSRRVGRWTVPGTWCWTYKRGAPPLERRLASTPLLGGYLRPLDRPFTFTHEGNTETRLLVWRDDEAPPTATLTVEASTITEGEDVVATVEISAPYSIVTGIYEHVILVVIGNGDGAVAGDATFVKGFTMDDGETAATVRIETDDDEAQSGIRELDISIGEFADNHTTGEPNSATVTVLDNDTPPSAVEDFTAEPGYQQVELNWQPPADGGGGQPITKYRYRYRPSTNSAWTLDWTDIPDGDASTHYERE